MEIGTGGGNYCGTTGTVTMNFGSGTMTLLQQQFFGKTCGLSMTGR